MSARLLAEVVSHTEDASGAAGGYPQSVESAVLRAFEDTSRTREGCFCAPNFPSVPETPVFTPNASENASRTPGSLFEHGTHIPYRRSLFLVPSAIEGVGKGSAGDKFRVSGGRRKRWKGPERTN